MADMLFCNLSETVHNKWLQMSRNQNNNLFDATCDDSHRAWIQMTNYKAYLQGQAPGTGPKKEELKLRAATRTGDPKKIVVAINSLPGVAELGTRIPHLEGEEVFGSSKRKANTPISDEGDSHPPDKVNFSKRHVKSSSIVASLDFNPGSNVVSSRTQSHYVTIPFESACDISKWHIARLGNKTSAKCHAQQRGTNMKCTAKIARACKGTPAPTYNGKKEQYGSHREILTYFWFCPDDIQHCVQGSKRKWVIDWLEVPKVWPVLLGTNLTREESMSLQHVGFCLEDKHVLSPRWLFNTSASFECVLYKDVPPPNPETYPTQRQNSNICCHPKSPTPEQRNKWKSSTNVSGTILGVTLLPLLGIGAVITFKSDSGSQSSKNIYRITVANFPACSCHDFVTMAVSSIGGRHQYVNCKHLYYIFCYFCKMDVQKDKFIHAPSFSHSEVKALLIEAGIIKQEE